MRVFTHRKLASSWVLCQQSGSRKEYLAALANAALRPCCDAGFVQRAARFARRTFFYSYNSLKIFTKIVIQKKAAH
jgi:hypothetical protein